MSSILIRRANMVYSGGGSRLPSGYTELAYIESNGSQYIKTGVTPSNTIGFYVDAQKTTNNSTDSFVIGARQSSGNTRCCIDIDHTASAGPFLFGWNTNTPVDSRVNVGLDRFSAEMNFRNSRKGIINGVERSGYTSQLSSTLSSGSYQIYLFALNRYGTVVSGFKGKVWSIKVTSGADIVHDYVPAMRDSDSVVGMYDLVSDTFLTNAGSGTFSYGTL